MDKNNILTPQVETELISLFADAYDNAPVWNDLVGDDGLHYGIQVVRSLNDGDLSDVVARLLVIADTQEDPHEELTDEAVYELADAIYDLYHDQAWSLHQARQLAGRGLIDKATLRTIELAVYASAAAEPVD